MTKKDKEEWMEFFGEAFREVVLPSLEDLQEQIDGVRINMATKQDIDRLGRRLISRENQLDRLGNKYDNHEKRIVKLELKNQI